MNTQFASNVHEFTENLFKAMLEEFDGKEVGSDEFNLETLMDFHFPNYKPGDKVKKMKKVVDPNKPKRALSGYTYFGKMWGKLSSEEKAEWNEKAAEASKA